MQARSISSLLKSVGLTHSVSKYSKHLQCAMTHARTLIHISEETDIVPAKFGERQQLS